MDAWGKAIEDAGLKTVDVTSAAATMLESKSDGELKAVESGASVLAKTFEHVTQVGRADGFLISYS